MEVLFLSSVSDCPNWISDSRTVSWCSLTARTIKVPDSSNGMMASKHYIYYFPSVSNIILCLAYIFPSFNLFIFCNVTAWALWKSGEPYKILSGVCQKAYKRLGKHGKRFSGLMRPKLNILTLAQTATFSKTQHCSSLRTSSPQWSIVVLAYSGAWPLTSWTNTLLLTD